MSPSGLFDHLIPSQPEKEVGKARKQLRKMIARPKSARDYKEKLGKANALNIFISSQLRKAKTEIAELKKTINEMNRASDLEGVMFEEENETWPEDHS